ncbi:MAG: SpoIID/LytB domain-containing protein [Aphanothece sp. CMT-3BRIN-NPC111]|nr:SpoIID/LytB domain-containing protein [Aphanothece sp. CMT-3BRIN-NPC111]
MGFCLFGLTAASGPAQKPTEVDLNVGIVQRFGEKPTDELRLEAIAGDQLTLRFLAGNMKPQTLKVDSVKLEVTQQPLPVPKVNERLVLGNYRSFETAEDAAEKWQAKGIEVEVAQPDRWQVWAKRDVYKTPLLRRLLLENLKTNGDVTAYLDTKVLQKQPQVSWVVNGLRYNRKHLDITAGKNLIEVSQAKDKKSFYIYEGRLQVQPNAYGTYTLVNEVPLETYLRGVVPHELNAGAPYAANKAQAIIARTYALRNLRRFAVDDYQLCADTQCQVYRGLTGTTAVADRAIAATKNQVLTYNNQLVDALYSSTSGGVTASFEDVWNGSGRPYLHAVVDSTANIWDLSRQPLGSEQNFRKFISLKQGFNETGWNTFRWSKASSLKQLTQDLQRYLQKTKSPLSDFQTIQQIQVAERSPAGRILKLEVQTDKGVVEIYKDDIRSAFMAPRSTLFYLQPIYGANKTLTGYAFVGGGLGHGVGLSQTGTDNLAKQGWSAEQILSFYYPGTKIQPIQESIVFLQIDPQSNSASAQKVRGNE